MDNIKNFFKKETPQKKEKEKIHPLLKRAQSLFEAKAAEPVLRITKPPVLTAKQKQMGLTPLAMMVANREKAQKQGKEPGFVKDKKMEKSGGHGHGKGKAKDPKKVQAYEAQKAQFIKENMEKIDTSFCSFGDNMEPIVGYENLIEYKFRKLVPHKLRVECTLYHGCEKICEPVYSKDVYFNSTVSFNQLITFGDIKYCQIPVKARLSFNIILIFEDHSYITIGCVSINLFNEKGVFNSGVRDLNVWPFYEIDERLGCMKEYDGLNREVLSDPQLAKRIHLLFTKLVLSFESFICPMMYSSRDGKKIEKL